MNLIILKVGVDLKLESMSLDTIGLCHPFGVIMIDTACSLFLKIQEIIISYRSPEMRLMSSTDVDLERAGASLLMFCVR